MCCLSAVWCEGTVPCMSQVCCPQEQPSNQGKIRPCLRGKRIRNRGRAIGRFFARGKIVGFMVSALTNAYPDPAARTNCPEGRAWQMEDVQMDASSRGQDGSDAGPECFELRVFLQGLRQKQHGSGAAWGIRRDSIKDFALRRCWHRRALSAIVCKMWLSLPKGKVAVDCSLHASLTFSSWRLVMSSPICPSCLPHRNCPYSFQHIQPSSRTFSQAVPKHCQWKIDVRIHASSRGQDGSDAGPESFELRVFLKAWGRSNIDGVQHGAFGRDSIKDFVLRGCLLDTEELSGLLFARCGFPCIRHRDRSCSFQHIQEG